MGSDVRLNTERIAAEEAAWQACIVDGQTYTSRDREAFASGYRAADVAGSWTTANAAEMGDFAKRIAGYMGQRNTPWADEATMREAVNETVRLLLTEASHETRALLAMPEDAAGSWNDTERLRTALADLRNCAKGYLPTPHSQSQIARVFAAADAALAESVPSPQVSS